MAYPSVDRPWPGLGWQCELVADGSYVMRRVDDPDDIDIVLAVPSEVFDQFERDELPLWKRNVLDPWFCKREYKVEVKACVLGGSKQVDWLRFFAQVSDKRVDKHGLPAGSSKGLVRVAL